VFVFMIISMPSPADPDMKFEHSPWVQTRDKPGPPGGIKYELDKHYIPWTPKGFAVTERKLFGRWDDESQQRETIVYCSNSGPDSLPGIPTSGKLPHCRGGYLSGVWKQPREAATITSRSDGVTMAEALFVRNTQPVVSAPSSVVDVDSNQLYIDRSSVQGVRPTACVLVGPARIDNYLKRFCRVADGPVFQRACESRGGDLATGH
jgi:hypothetical protein